MGWCNRLAAWLRPAAAPASAAGIAVLALGLAPLAAAAPWPASEGPGPNSLGVAGQFGLAPMGQHGEYFQLAVAPGHAATAAFVVANLAKASQTLTLGHAAGITAGNGGSAYRPASARCSGPACWVTGLPSRVTLPANGREEVAFTVRVPPGTRPGQYLSGIAAGSATRSTPVQLGSNGHGGAAQAVIHNTVTIGVAITVGDLSTLVSQLSIRGVQGVDEGPVARLNISLYNTGHTFSRSAGQASCQAAGRWKSYRVSAGTVLPGDHALIAVNAPGLPEGKTVQCAIQLRYGKSQLVSWSGPVAIPGAPAGHYVRTGAGSYALVSDGIPAWGIALIVLCILLLGTVCLLLYRQRRPRLR